MAEETIFSKIIRQEIPTPLLYQDDLVTAFRDITPQASTHIIIIPNKLIPTINDVSESNINDKIEPNINEIEIVIRIVPILSYDLRHNPSYYSSRRPKTYLKFSVLSVL